MGMLIAGRWTDEDRVIEDGAYRRPPSRFADDLPRDIVDAVRAQPGRFHLIASASCPWSQRTVLARALKGLAPVLPL